MRILLLSQFYPPVTGGVEVHVSALAEGLAARGHHVAVATLDGEQMSGSPVEVHRLPSTTGGMGFLHVTERHHAPPVPDPAARRALAGLVERFAPDVVHAHNWLGRSFVPLAPTSEARYVETLHDCGLICTQGRRMHDGTGYCETDGAVRCLACCARFFGPLKGGVTFLGNRAMRARELATVDLFLPVSHAVAEANRLAELGARFEVVPNFVAEREEGAATPPELAALPDGPLILQVGDVVPDKGVHVLFEAYRTLEAPPPLVLVGRIAAEVRAALPGGAIAVGVWPHAAVRALWNRALFGTMPSLCLDACPTVTMEAMAASRPVIASARGGLTDQVVDGQTGILVAPGDAEALAGAMRRLIADEKLRHAMGTAGRQRFERHYSADVVIDRIEELYASLLRP